MICVPELRKEQDVDVDGHATHCEGHQVTDSVLPQQVAEQVKAFPVSFSLSQVITKSASVLSVTIKEVVSELYPIFVAVTVIVPED